MERGTPFVVEVNPKIPRRLMRLEEIAGNLWYSWNRSSRTLFARLHPGLWDAVGHSPKAFLKRVDEQRLVDAVDDQVFLANFNRILSAYDTYHSEPMRHTTDGLQQSDLVAYFCAEFGFHESFPIYSGGLGILAGDHCKAASDMRLPFVAVGLLYRQGYFSQMIDAEGNQIATYADSDFDDLPVAPALRDDGSEVFFYVDLPGRKVCVKVWQARVGHVWLYLLDTDIENNSAEDRDICHQLYGGNRYMRIEQEIILGVGGVRALQEVGLKPTVWHINEGHAAFQILERARSLVSEELDFAGALEAVAANTVFTTHTPVPAGHDHFSQEMMMEYFGKYLDELRLDRESFLSLGLAPDSQEFNMTALAIHGSRFQNGVSRIHGEVSARICGDLWPQVAPNENPMTYVTNGVHVSSFLADEWIDLFDNFLGYEWRHRLCDKDFWERIDQIPDHLFWSVRQSLKSQMLYQLRHRVTAQHFRNHGSEAHLDRLLKFTDPINPNVLTIGFARRFATYKRATMLFENLDWLREIISDQDRPVLFIFAGKAHPADKPGQDLIKQIDNFSRLPEMEGKIMMVEGYDLGLARRLVSGVDVWLNNPVFPLEASGTSGMKAGINGVINLSVLDGWWGEGYDGKNGWAIKPSPEQFDDARRNKEESQTLYEILQDQVLPLYYNRGKFGYSEGWIKMAKHSIATLLPSFNATRMVGEYVNRFYMPASSQGKIFAKNNFESAQKLAVWKAQVRAGWHAVSLHRLDESVKRIQFGEALHFEVAVRLNGLKPEDVVVELLVNRPGKLSDEDAHHYKFEFQRMSDDGQEHIYALEFTPGICGKLQYKVRIYPWHELMTHAHEMGLMVWL